MGVEFFPPDYAPPTSGVVFSSPTSSSGADVYPPNFAPPSTDGVVFQQVMVDPVYVTGLPLSWRGCNGRYSPVYDRDGKFTNTWECDRTSYWGMSLRPVIIRFDDDDKKWMFQTEGFLGLPTPLFKSRRGPSQGHPCSVTWCDGIKVSHFKPWFWQVL